MDRKLDHVIAQLNSYSGQKKAINSTSHFVCCPFHHEDTPSFRIFHSPATKSPGWGKCYGCGASKPWDDFAAKLGLEPYKYTKPTEQFSSSIVEAIDSTETETLTFSELPVGKVWRSIKTDFLAEVGCHKVVNKWGTAFVYLPVIVMGEERGYIKARLKKVEGKPSYINKKGNWSADYGLFPYDFAVSTKPKVIVLVEGPRDSLRLNYYGIPTMAILGTQSWSERKNRLVSLSGAKTVILAMDGDCAGIAAEAKIELLLSKLVNVRVFSLHGWDSPYHKYANEDFPTKSAKADGVTLWDPGNCPISKIKELKQLVKELS